MYYFGVTSFAAQGDCIPRGCTINAEDYGKTIRNLKLALEQKRPNFNEQKNDRRMGQNARKVDDIIKDCGFTKLHHIPYGRDLAHSDFCYLKI